MRLSTLVVLALCTSLAEAQAPPNDHCPYSTTLTIPQTVTGSTVGAGLWTASPCSTIGADVWFKFTAPYTGTATASTCGNTFFDTILVIWDYPCGLIAYGCSDDYCGLQSSLTVPITAGVTYQIQLGGYQGATGSYTLSLTGIPANDSCTAAIPLSLGITTYGNTTGATTGPEPTPACVTTTKDLWYSFVAPVCGNYTATTCVVGSTYFDTVMGLWQGSCGALTPLDCNDDSCGVFAQSQSSTITFYATAGSTRLISVGGYFGSYGPFGLVVTPIGPQSMTLTFSNAGAGTLGFNIVNGPFGGSAFTAATLNHGGYPAGWFFGVDVSMAEIITQWTSGYPFLTALDACGNATLGPFGGLPHNLAIYGVALGFPSGSTVSSMHTSPATGTVP